MTAAPGEPRAQERGSDSEPPVVVRDKRRIDPRSGQVRPEETPAAATPGAATAAPGAPGGTVEADLRTQVAERTADLQRLKAEYDNYRRRMDRDRSAAADQSVARVLAALLPTLDDIGRAREHGDLEGPFKAVADSLESALDGLGLERFGQRGEQFDPLVHDALMHSYRTDVTRPTAVDVFRSGYRYAGRVLRPAQVAVAEPPLDAPLDSAPSGPSDRPDPAAAEASAPGPRPDDTGSIPDDAAGDGVRAE